MGYFPHVACGGGGALGLRLAQVKLVPVGL